MEKSILAVSCRCHRLMYRNSSWGYSIGGPFEESSDHAESDRRMKKSAGEITSRTNEINYEARKAINNRKKKMFSVREQTKRKIDGDWMNNNNDEQLVRQYAHLTSLGVSSYFISWLNLFASEIFSALLLVIFWLMMTLMVAHHLTIIAIWGCHCYCR